MPSTAPTPALNPNAVWMRSYTAHMCILPCSRSTAAPFAPSLNSAAPCWDTRVAACMYRTDLDCHRDGPPHPAGLYHLAACRRSVSVQPHALILLADRAGDGVALRGRKVGDCVGVTAAHIRPPALSDRACVSNIIIAALETAAPRARMFAWTLKCRYANSSTPHWHVGGAAQTHHTDPPCPTPRPIPLINTDIRSCSAWQRRACCCSLQVSRACNPQRSGSSGHVPHRSLRTKTPTPSL